MGYILPITNHTYVNYHLRELEEDKSAHHIDAAYKVMLSKIQRDGHNPYSNQYALKEVEEEIMSSKQLNTRHDRKNSYMIDKFTKAELTGKGMWMNQQV